MSEEVDFEKTWTARQAAMEEILGPSGEHVFHAVIPFYLGGDADVMIFPGHAGGVAYATGELTGGSGQPSNSFWDEYEFVICLRDEHDWAPNLISRLAAYTFEATVDPGETMDIGPSLPQPTALTAFLFVEYGTFRLLDKTCGLLLCVGITSDELAECMAGKSKEVLNLLRVAGVFPFTDLQRASVVGRA